MHRFGGTPVAVAVCLVASTACGQVREQKPNFVGGELLGRGLVATLNYERWQSNHVGLGAGLMAIGTSDGLAVALPLYVSAATGDVHSFYVSGGTTYIGGSDVEDYEDAWLVTMSAGYQFHSYSGFYVRPIFTLFLPTGGEEGFLIWPGISIGGSF